MITKSIIEDFELANGTEVYIQASMMGDISLSFDSIGGGVNQRLTKAEAKKLAEKINKVLEEAN